MCLVHIEMPPVDTFGEHSNILLFAISCENAFESFPWNTLIYKISSCSKICSILHLNFITRAGTPPTILYGGTSLHTTAPAAIIAPHPIATPDNKVTLHPIYHGIRQ